MPPLSFDKGKLIYTPDSLGNRIPDFSYCGYMALKNQYQHVPVKVIVPVTKGDATLRIQSALDYVASLPVDANGFRELCYCKKELMKYWDSYVLLLQVLYCVAVV